MGGAPHYWTNPCGLQGAWDYATMVMLAVHIGFFFHTHVLQSNAWYYQRLWWVREVLYTATDNKISQIQNFRSKLMVLGFMKTLAGLAAMPMSQMAIAQKAEIARVRPLVPFACMVGSILCFVQVTINLCYMHFYSLAAQKVGDVDAIPEHSTNMCYDPNITTNGGGPLSRRGSLSEKSGTPFTKKVKWSAQIAGTLASLVTDAALAYSVGWHLIRIGFAFLLWPFDPLVCFIASIVMLGLISQGNMNRFNKKSLSLTGFASTEYYAEILRDRGYSVQGSPPATPGTMTRQKSSRTE